MSRVKGQGKLTPPDLPGYRYLQDLGSGGYSEVYLYEQDMPRRKVAVKVLHEAGLTEATRRQFTTEANAMAGLADHPHIVQVFDASVTGDGRPYLVMQYYPQPNLSVRARREHFSVADVLRIGIQIGSAVETAHRDGILHRDIKPHNILTGQFGTPALTDFGIATTKDAEPSASEGMSLPWSPPEILYSASAGDARSDVYSLGATLWHLLVGRSPFEEPGGDNRPLALMRRIQSEPPPGTGRGDVPDSLERLLRQTMAKDPAMRPQTALDFVRALQAIEQEQRLALTQIVLAADETSLPDRPADGEGESTRVRGAQRIDPQMPAPPTGSARDAVRPPSPWDEQATRARGAVRVDPAPVAATGGERRRQMPEFASSADPTARRPARPTAPADGEAGPGGPTGPETVGGGRRSRILGVTVGGVLAVAAIGIAVVLASPRHAGGSGAGGSTATGSTSTGSGGGGSPIGSTAPGTPVVVPKRVSAKVVVFRWTYTNPAKGDAFRWRRVSGGSGPATAVTAEPKLRLTVARGQTVCITVQVVRGDQASDASAPACGP